MFKTVHLQVHERALLLRDGRPERMLPPGRHTLFSLGSDIEVRRYDLNAWVVPATPELLAVLSASDGIEHTVDEDSLGLVRVEGIPFSVLKPGRWVLWQARAEVTCENVSVRPLEARALPVAFRALCPPGEIVTVAVSPYQRALLYVDGQMTAVLEEGIHPFFGRDRTISSVLVDLREREIQIIGQDVMTADKVTLRLNLVVKFRVVDPVASVHAVASLHDAVYSEAQVCARRHVAGRTVDAILEQRAETSEQLRAELAARLALWGVELARVDLKDLILPGEMKSLLNQVIEAEKRAAANVILRREETAATRSLANTAKLLESNPTLLRLKELESWKEIAATVGSVTVVASPQQLLGQLSLGAPAKG